MGVKIEVLTTLHTSELPGTVIEVEETRAAKLIKQGKARLVQQVARRRRSSTRETAVEAPETRATDKGEWQQ